MKVKIEMLEEKTNLGGELYCLSINGDKSANNIWPGRSGLCLHEVLQCIGDALAISWTMTPCKICFGDA